MSKFLILLVYLISNLNIFHFSSSFNQNNRFCEPSFQNFTVSCDDRQISNDGYFEFDFYSNDLVTGIELLNDDAFISHLNVSLSELIISFTVLGECELIFFFTSQDCSITYNFYIAQSSQNVYYSSHVSMDTAYRLAEKELPYLFIDEDDSINRFSNAPLIKSGTVSGQVVWTDNLGNQYPLIGAHVKAAIGNSSIYNDTYTDENGCYELDYYNGIFSSGNLKVYVILEDEQNYSLWNYGTYSICYEFNSNSGDLYQDFYIDIPTYGDFAKASYIFAIMQQFVKVAKSQDFNNDIYYCKVWYPSTSNTCCYDYSASTIEICERSSNNSLSPNSYSDWDVIGHEYGHHIQYCCGFLFTSPIQLNHGFTTRYINYFYHNDVENFSLELAKYYGLNSCFTESWATYWGVCAQRLFDDFILDIYPVGDFVYSSSNGAFLDFTSSFNTRGDDCEQNIIISLYELTNTFISPSATFNSAFNNFVHYQFLECCTNFSDFINILYYYGYDKTKIGNILTKNKIACTFIDLYGDTLVWDYQTGNVDLNFNNFKIKIFDENENIIISLGFNDSISDNMYQLSEQQMEYIYNYCSDTIYAQVISTETYSFDRGPYYSKLFPIYLEY